MVRNLTKFLVFGLMAAGGAERARALPQIEQGFLADTGLGDQTQPQIRIYRDHDDPQVFWWAPYQLGIEAAPVTGVPRLSWTAHAARPRIGLAAGLFPLAEMVVDRVRAQVAAAAGLAENAVDLRPLELLDVSLVVGTPADGGVVAGEWQPQTALLIRNVPETIALEGDENARLLALAPAGQAGLRVTIAFRGVFPALRTERRYQRTYEPACVVATLAGARTLAAAAGKAVTKRRLYGMAADFERLCVTKLASTGEMPTLLERMDDWPKELVGQGVLVEQGGGWALTGADALERFRARTALSFAVEVPEDVRLYPVEFGRLLTELKVTE